MTTIINIAIIIGLVVLAGVVVAALVAITQTVIYLYFVVKASKRDGVDDDRM